MNSPQAGHWRTTISWWIEASSFLAQHFFRRRLSSTRELGSSVRPPSTVEGDAGWLPILPASRYRSCFSVLLSFSEVSVYYFWGWGPRTHGP